jgi:hypothetical protein
MLPDAIKERLKVSPFKPFVLKLGSGDTYLVRHPELASISPGGRRLILWIGDEQAIDLDLLLVESVQDAPGNGQRRRRSA